MGQDHVAPSVSAYDFALAPGVGQGTASVAIATGLVKGAEDRIISNTANGTV